MNKITSLMIGILSLVIGVFYTFVPHSIHISSGLDYGLIHGTHIMIGVAFLAVGGFLLWKARR